MRKDFDKLGYNFVEIKESGEEIEIILSSRDPNTPRTTIVNSVSVTKEEFINLISDIKIGENQ